MIAKYLIQLRQSKLCRKGCCQPPYDVTPLETACLLGLKVGGAIRYYDWAVTSPWPFGRGLLTTNKGEDDGVYMSMAAYEEREKMFRHRDKIYAAEISRLSGGPVCTPEELDERMEELFRAYEK